MVHGRIHERIKKIAAILIVLLSTACSGSKIKKADCYDCPSEDQKWTKFSWHKLEGTWRGNVEISADRLAAAKWEKATHWVELSFLEGKKFLNVYKVEACDRFPQESVVLLQAVWFKEMPTAWPPQTKEPIFEVFGRADSNRVSYGRVYFDRKDGKHVCHYQSFGGKVSMNRLAMPALAFSERMSPDGRLLASGETKEYELNFEFLNFVDEAKPERFAGRDSRAPASENKDNPPLFFRVVKITKSVNSPYASGKWESTEEYLYRLWRVD